MHTDTTFILRSYDTTSSRNQKRTFSCKDSENIAYKRTKTKEINKLQQKNRVLSVFTHTKITLLVIRIY